ncbi:ATP-binding protein [candidate division KSB1 bacterium]|nr:ATP-binding protein [candidate division KSB1 bacterium]
MKELVIISGKGGTGKTTITAALASLIENKVMADCDVDAADLHLIFKPTIERKIDFFGGKIASIRGKDCISCGKCIEVCQFNAISDDFTVDPISCEGCGVCVWFCPVDAIDFKEHLNGHLYVSDTRFGPFVHAKLGIAEENSGKLVTLVRKQAKEIAEKRNAQYIVIDGSPGVGCPVISSIAGSNAVLIVTEPTKSGVHDLQRVAQLSRGHFNILTFVCVNKYDLNEEITDNIEDYCLNNNLAFAGKIPYDVTITRAMVAGVNIFEYRSPVIEEAIRAMWSTIHRFL